jgi:hypothetical protein
VSEALDPRLFDAAARLLGALRWTGVAMVEFKGDGEAAVLVEINGRVWGALPLAVAAGVDFPALLVELLLKGPPTDGPTTLPAYRVGVRSRDLDLERAWIAEVFRRRSSQHLPGRLPTRPEALAVALRLLWPPDGYDVLDRRDPGPGLAEVARLLGGPVWSALRRRRPPVS